MGCLVTLNGTARDCAGSMGGIRKAYIINHAAVTGVTVTADEISAITLAAEAKWSEYNFNSGTGSVTQTATIDKPNGINFIVVDIAMVLTRTETAKRIEMEALRQGELAVVIVDNNGKWWYFGMGDYFVTASANTATSGTASGDANSYTINLGCESLSLAYALTEEAKTALLALVNAPVARGLTAPPPAPKGGAKV